MKPMPNIECLVSFRQPMRAVDCRSVLLPGETPMVDLIGAARVALYKQHEIYGCPITSIRVRSNHNRSLDYVVRPDLRDQKRKVA